jgi:hypothetical protein
VHFDYDGGLVLGAAHCGTGLWRWFGTVFLLSLRDDCRFI